MKRKSVFARLFHVHTWHVVQAFTAPSDWPWPPMWACPCGDMKDMQSLEDWGFPS